jgi:hypothetical protein
MKCEIRGIRELKRKLAQLESQLETTIELDFDIYLKILIQNIRNRISDETGPNGPKYKMAKEKVFGESQPYKVTGSLINNIQSKKVPGKTNKELSWWFGVQPDAIEDTYSVKLIFEMFRTGNKNLTPDIHKLSAEIAQELETKYPNFKYFYKFIGDNADVIRPRLIEELEDIILKIVEGIFK